jgi:hypothetical protein
MGKIVLRIFDMPPILRLPITEAGTTRAEDGDDSSVDSQEEILQQQQQQASSSSSQYGDPSFRLPSQAEMPEALAGATDPFETSKPNVERLLQENQEWLIQQQATRNNGFFIKIIGRS